MSYSKFLDDLNDFYKIRHKRGDTDRPSLEDAQNAVRDDWLKDERYGDLTSFILENWDSGNCDEFMRPLIQRLLDKRDLHSFKRLWNGVLRNKIETTWFYV